MHTYAQKRNPKQKQASLNIKKSSKSNFAKRRKQYSIQNTQCKTEPQEMQRRQAKPDDLEYRSGSKDVTHFAHDFSKISIHSKSPGKVQAKLKVNDPGDIYEQEADRIADQVLAVPSHSAVCCAPSHIQRFAGQATRQADTAHASVDRVLASSGRPLEPALKRDMEQRFDHDFSLVRVHSGAAAEQSARDVNAHAYTMGHNIVFGAGRFAPATHEGQRLIAHELTHVVQQSGSDVIYAGRRNKKRGQSTTVAETNNTPATEVIARHGQVLVQREACESLAPPDCSKGTCEEGKQCVGGDWPVCSCWSKADEGGSRYKGGGGRSGGGGSTDSWDE